VGGVDLLVPYRADLTESASKGEVKGLCAGSRPRIPQAGFRYLHTLDAVGARVRNRTVTLGTKSLRWELSAGLFVFRVGVWGTAGVGRSRSRWLTEWLMEARLSARAASSACPSVPPAARVRRARCRLGRPERARPSLTLGRARW
jgi:hypothetical protein